MQQRSQGQVIPFREKIQSWQKTSFQAQKAFLRAEIEAIFFKNKHNLETFKLLITDCLRVNATAAYGVRKGGEEEVVRKREVIAYGKQIHINHCFWNTGQGNIV